MFPIRDINPVRIVPLITIGIIALNVLVFFFWQPTAETELAEFTYEQAAIACEITTAEPLSESEIFAGECTNDGATGFFPDKNVFVAAVVSMFLHAGLLHLGSNMWFLWIFGNNVEEAWGIAWYIGMYLVTGLAATAAFVFLNPDSTIPLVGASGAIAGVLGSYLVLFPQHKVLSWFVVFVVPVPAILFLGLWFASQFGFQGEGIAWEAHAGGFIAGVLITLPFRSMLLKRVTTMHDPQESVFGIR